MQSFFEHYDQVMSIFPSLPLHARIAVDIEGVLTHEHREIGWTLLEAKLFEDLAMLWNESLDAERRLDGSKTAAKRHEALLRATTRAVFLAVFALGVIAPASSEAITLTNKLATASSPYLRAVAWYHEPFLRS